MLHRTTTYDRIDCGHLDFNDPKVVELHRCNLPHTPLPCF